MRFHVDACAPRSPEHKGKVERRIRDHRLGVDPRGREWMSLAALQAWTDEGLRARAKRRVCPATGTSVWDAWQREREEYLQPLPSVLPQPSDVSVMRKVSRDCLVCFEHRQYSVPFRFIGRELEVRGCADTVQVYAHAELVAEHPRGTDALIVLDPAHYEGAARRKCCRRNPAHPRPAWRGQNTPGRTLGVKAVMAGFSVAFYRIEELLVHMRRDAIKPPAHIHRRKYLKSALLVIDEMDFDPHRSNRCQSVLPSGQPLLRQGCDHHHHQQGDS